jgi:hypothetical protein
MSRFFVFVAAAVCAWPHVGSPDIFHEAAAGPYRLLVTIRPPLVIPGVAEIEIRTDTADVDRVRITPTPLTGDGAKFAPTPDVAVRSKDDPRFFTGSLWMMASGSWQVRVSVDGAKGNGRLNVPVPTLASRTEKMNLALAAVLFALLLLLAACMVSIFGAASREALLEPWVQADERDGLRARRTMIATALTVVLLLWLGNKWWDAEATNYDRYIYKPLVMTPSLKDGKLRLVLSDPGWLGFRSLDDFLPDHNHLMHLYVIRMPEMDRIWHLHPELSSPGIFEHALPAMPAGNYILYADLVHQNGFPETLVGRMDIPAIAGKTLEGDDSAGEAPPIRTAPTTTVVAVLGDGHRMVWEREMKGYSARTPHLLRFRIEDAKGQPAQGMEFYMGMAGHAAIVSPDGSVFAHVHPYGSVPMAALQLTSPDPHAGHAMPAEGLPPSVVFPYGFPKAGRYRIFVQVKRAGKIETGVFDVDVAG